MTQHVRRLAATTALLGLLAVAASPPVLAIEDGTPIGPQEQQDFGLVTVNGGSCSGVLIANDWILTAGHCMAGHRTNPNSADAAIVGDKPANADAIYLFAGFADEVGPDLALAHLQRPLRVNGSTTGVKRPFWNGTMADLANGTRTVSIYGQGNNDYVAPPPPPPPVDPCDRSLLRGNGPYRSGTAQIGTVSTEPQQRPGSFNAETAGFHPAPNGRYYQLVHAAGRTQLILPGDSGGPTFIFNPPDATPYLLGIHSGANCTVSGGTGTTGTGNDVAIPAVRDWIGAVLKSQWGPTTSTASHVWVSPGELNGVRWPVDDVNTVNWAQAARAASAMCYARGFAGGHFTGHQDQRPGVQTKNIQCSGGDTAWFDLTDAEVEATGWGFSDVNTVDWARAGRAAANYCTSKGFVGGQSTGHQRDGRRGVFCYRSGATYLDATDADIAATKWGFNTAAPETAPWAQGARAANEYCRGHGYVGGFLSGHHLPNKTGVVCQN